MFLLKGVNLHFDSQRVIRLWHNLVLIEENQDPQRPQPPLKIALIINAQSRNVNEVNGSKRKQIAI